MINLTIDADDVVQRIRCLRVAVVIAVIVAVLVIIVSATLGILLPNSGKEDVVLPLAMLSVSFSEHLV